MPDEAAVCQVTAPQRERDGAIASMDDCGGQDLRGVVAEGVVVSSDGRKRLGQLGVTDVRATSCLRDGLRSNVCHTVRGNHGQRRRSDGQGELTAPSTPPDLDGLDLCGRVHGHLQRSPTCG